MELIFSRVQQIQFRMVLCQIFNPVLEKEQKQIIDINNKNKTKQKNPNMHDFTELTRSSCHL